MEHKEYKISNQTIKDIINNIPKDKWPSVVYDLNECLSQASCVIEVMEVAANELGVDDGKCENEFNFVDQEGNQQGNIKFGEDGVEVK